MAFPKLTRPLLAYVLPFAAFMAALGLVSLAGMAGGEDAPFWLKEPKYWIFPLQTVVCAGLLLFYWRDYDFGPSRHMLPAVLLGVFVFFVWVTPQMFFGAPRRWDGFDPYVFEGSGGLFWLSLLARFARLVIVVPLLEEIFWRGFLLRYLIKEDFTSIPVGTPSMASFSAVVFLFAFVHDFEDFGGAIVAGVVYNSIALGTRSLGACVIAHAVTNLLLGVYVLQTRQWGFW